MTDSLSMVVYAFASRGLMSLAHRMDTHTSLTLSQVWMQGDKLVPYLFVIWLDYVLWTSTDLMKENGFILAKARSRRYPARTITDADDIAFLANTPVQAESLLYCLERAAGGIGLHVNADKTECMCFD